MKRTVLWMILAFIVGLASVLAKLSHGALVEHDIIYSVPAKNKPLKLDLYLPPNPGKKAMPVVIWIHGGGWNSGSKSHGGRLMPLLEKGIAVADINYRYSGQAPFPAQIIDCKTAVRWLRKNAEHYNLNPDRIGAAGDSAGGHLAALLGTSNGVEDFESEEYAEFSSTVQAVCDLSGPTDMLAAKNAAQEKDLGSVARLVGGNPEEEPYRSVLESTNPANYVDGSEPPFLIIHGTADRRVPTTQSKLLHDTLVSADIDTTLILIEGANHALNGGTKVSHKKIDKMIVDFFENKLKE